MRTRRRELSIPNFFESELMRNRRLLIRDVEAENSFDEYWTSEDLIFTISERNKTFPGRIGGRVVAKYPETTNFYAGQITEGALGQCNILFDNDRTQNPHNVESIYVFPLRSGIYELPRPDENTVEDSKDTPPLLTHDLDLESALARLPSVNSLCDCGRLVRGGTGVRCFNLYCDTPLKEYHKDCVGISEDT